MKNGKVRRKGRVMLGAVLFAASLTACGSSGSLSYTEGAAKNAASYAAADTAAAEPAAFEYAEEAYDGGAGMSYDMTYAEEDVQDQQESVEVGEAAAQRKLIKTVNISTETEQFDILVPALQAQVEQLGGYIEEISIYNNTSYSYEGRTEALRGASMTARVPQANLDSFLAQVGEQSNVVSQSERVEDVTLQYVDLDSHKRVLVSEQERLIELLAQAETVEDLITIEGRLSEVRYQIESMESQLRTYDNKIDYSTVYLGISEVKKYTPPQDISVWQKIGSGFVNSLENIGDGICNFFIGFLINIPYIVLWTVIIAVSVLIIRQIRRALRNRRQKSEETGYSSFRGAKHFAGKKDKMPSAEEDEKLLQEDRQEEQKK